MNIQELNPKFDATLNNFRAWCVTCLKPCKKKHDRFNWCVEGKFPPKRKR